MSVVQTVSLRVFLLYLGLFWDLYFRFGFTLAGAFWGSGELGVSKVGIKAQVGGQVQLGSARRKASSFCDRN